jgi:signal peptidase
MELTADMAQRRIPAHGRSNNARASVGTRLLGYVGDVFTLLAVIIGTLAVVIAIASHFSPRGEYTVFGRPVMSVLSGSMSPAIKTGDLIYDSRVTPARAQHLHAGQIISFRQPGGKIFTHRIHAVDVVNGNVSYQTKGDANNAPDQGLVSPSQIVGLYEGKVPFGGYVLNALHKPVSLGLLLAAPLLWLLSGWLLSMAKDTEEKNLAVPNAEEAPVV